MFIQNISKQWGRTDWQPPSHLPMWQTKALRGVESAGAVVWGVGLVCQHTPPLLLPATSWFCPALCPWPSGLACTLSCPRRNRPAPCLRRTGRGSLPGDLVLNRNSWEPGSILPPAEQRLCPWWSGLQGVRGWGRGGAEDRWQERLAHKAGGLGLEKGLTWGTAPGAESSFSPSWTTAVGQ